MRISELSARSGVPIPTLKFYLRERLLPPGRPMGARQAEYGEAHLRRLHLIKTLTDVGRLSLRDVGRVLEAIDDERRSLHYALGVAQYALGSAGGAIDDSADLAAACAEVDALIGAMGWTVTPDAPARTALARAIASLRALAWPVGVGNLRRYAEAADALAGGEVESVRSAASRAEAVERLVVGTVVFDTVVVALRRIAQESHSAES